MKTSIPHFGRFTYVCNQNLNHMKKLILTLVVLTLFAKAFAQSDYQKIRLGFMLSPQISWIKSDSKEIESGGGLAGYNFGIFMDRFFAPNYAFATGLTINTTGGILKYNDVSTTYRLKYIDIPWGLKLKTSDSKRTVFYGQFGLNTQFNIKAVDGDGNNESDNIGFFDMGYHFGGGIEYGLGGSNYLMFGAQYNNGFIDITTMDGVSDNANLNRLVFQIGLIF